MHCQKLMCVSALVPLEQLMLPCEVTINLSFYKKTAFCLKDLQNKFKNDLVAIIPVCVLLHTVMGCFKYVFYISVHQMDKHILLGHSGLDLKYNLTLSEEGNNLWQLFFDRTKSRR